MQRPASKILLSSTTVQKKRPHCGVGLQRGPRTGRHTVGPFARVTVDTLTLSAGDDVTLAATDGQTVVKNEYRIIE